MRGPDYDWKAHFEPKPLEVVKASEEEIAIAPTLAGIDFPHPEAPHATKHNRKLLADSFELRRSYTAVEPTKELLLDFVSRLHITEGHLLGEPFKILPFQRDFLEGFVDKDISVLSVPRGNGKSYLAGAIALAYLIGPFARANSTIAVYAGTNVQANATILKIIELACHVIPSYTRMMQFKLFNITNSRIIYTPLNSRIESRPNSVASVQGASPQLVIMDELSSWIPGKGETVFNAILTSLGKMPKSKAVLVGIKPASPDHFFSRYMLNDDKDINVCVYAQEPTDDDSDMSEEAAKRANPAWSHMPDLRKAINRDRRHAIDDPAKARTYRADRLNMGSSMYSNAMETFINQDVVEAICRPRKDEPPRSGNMIIGIDMGANSSISCACAYWMDTGRVEIYAGLPVDVKSIFQWERDSLVPTGFYQELIKKGELWTYSGTKSLEERFLKDLQQAIFDEHYDGNQVIYVMDRYKYRVQSNYLVSVGVKTNDIKFRTPRGQGQHGFENYRAVIEELNTADLCVARGRAIFSNAMHNLVVARHPTQGNPYVRAARKDVRIDAGDAFILAATLGNFYKNDILLDGKKLRKKMTGYTREQYREFRKQRMTDGIRSQEVH